VPGLLVGCVVVAACSRAAVRSEQGEAYTAGTRADGRRMAFLRRVQATRHKPRQPRPVPLTAAVARMGLARLAALAKPRDRQRGAAARADPRARLAQAEMSLPLTAAEAA
jgi:hypothetical protein